MRISYQWLRDYLPFDLPPEQLAAILTDLGLEVESMETWESVKGGMKNFVIGHVLACVKHPNADKLLLTTVDAGTGSPLKIVCGAPNVAAGQKVLVALPGAKIISGKEEFEIKKTKIRGEESEGMICAEDEAGLGTSHEGILVLDQDAVPGTPASEYFGVTTDTVFEIGLTPNRIDAASHYGIARDLAARFSLSNPVKAKLPELPDLTYSGSKPPVSVVIENIEGCRRYAGWYIQGVKVGPSPSWLQNRLKAVGLNPICNVVDVTNYVMYETGQPLHAFDAAKIQGNKVVVKNLPSGTSFITLDGVERTLEATDLMICNAAEPMALAGIFGGLLSGINDNTKDIFLESACFDPRTVRRTARRLGLATDASFRFERGTDPAMVPYALKRAAWLITQIAGGTITGPVVDEYPVQIKETEVQVNCQRINTLIGKEIPGEILRSILASLDMEILEDKGSDLLLKIPLYRVDVHREADVVEEVLRIYGFNNVEVPERIHATLSYVPKPDKEKITHLVCDYLTGAGFSEIMCNSLTRSAYYRNNPVFPEENLVRILNPLSSDLDCMRQTLLYGGLETIQFNRNRKNSDLLLYEVGKVYFFNKQANGATPLSRYSEYLHLAMFATGNRYEKNWTTPEQPVDFFSLKGWVSAVLHRLGFDPEEPSVEEISNALFAYGLKYTIGGKVVVEFGEVSNRLTEEFDCKAPVFYADFHWEALLDLAKNHRVIYKEIPRFPEVRRDLSMVLDEKVTYAQLRDLAFKTENNLLKKLNLFDVYKGEKIGPGKKSYAITYILQDLSKTLTDEEIDAVMKKLISAYEKELGAVIRQ